MEVKQEKIDNRRIALLAAVRLGAEGETSTYTIDRARRYESYLNELSLAEDTPKTYKFTYLYQPHMEPTGPWYVGSPRAHIRMKLMKEYEAGVQDATVITPTDTWKLEREENGN